MMMFLADLKTIIKADRGVFAGGLLIACAALAIDLVLPFGVLAGAFYIAVVLPGIRTRSIAYPYAMAAVATAFMLVGVSFAPLGDVPFVVVANRVITLLAIWTIALLLRQRADTRAVQGKIRSTNEKLELLENAIKEMAQGYVIYDDNLRLVSFNTQYERIFEFPEGFLRPGLLLDDVVRNNGVRWQKESGDAGEDRIRRHIERSRDRSERTRERSLTNGRTYLYHRKPLPNGAFITTYTDITARKDLERSLRESEERFRRAFLDTSVGVAIRNVNDRTLVTNDALCRMFGYSHDELEKIHFGDITHPDDQHLNKKRHERIRSGEAQASHINKRIVRKDGEIIWVTSDMSTVCDDNGVPIFTINIYQDVTNLKRAESEASKKSALLETTIHNMAQGYAAFDGERRLVAFNRQFARMRGWPDDLLYLGMPYEELTRYRLRQKGLDGEGADTVLAGRVSSIKAMDERVGEYTSPDGGAYIHQRRPIPGGGFVVTLTDITARKIAEDQSRRALEAAETANRAKSEFLANMSHELRTPLNAIIGFSEMMKNESFGPLGSPKYNEYTDDIFTSGHHLLGLINDILDLSKAEAGKMELYEEEIDPAGATLSCLNMIKDQARKQGVELVPEIVRDNIRLRADQKMFRQIVINILTNAIKFTPPGGKIWVKAWAQPTSGYVLQIVDTGIGIEPGDIPKMLQPFTQGESAANRRHHGTGLGLPLTKRLIELHGGILDIQSQPGEGTTVTIRFPKERMLSDPGVRLVASSG
jgi:PAS domain S-box-containing protein